MPSRADLELVDSLNAIRHAQGRPALTEAEAQAVAAEPEARPAAPSSIIEGDEEAALAELRKRTRRAPARG